MTSRKKTEHGIHRRRTIEPVDFQLHEIEVVQTGTAGERGKMQYTGTNAGHASLAACAAARWPAGPDPM